MSLEFPDFIDDPVTWVLKKIVKIIGMTVRIFVIIFIVLVFHRLNLNLKKEITKNKIGGAIPTDEPLFLLISRTSLTSLRPEKPLVQKNSSPYSKFFFRFLKDCAIELIFSLFGDLLLYAGIKGE